MSNTINVLKFIKLRTKKNYIDASSHVLIGKVRFYSNVFIRLKCRSFHFKGVTLTTDQIVEGEPEERVVPWSNIECINILPDNFDWQNAKLREFENGIYLGCDKYATLVNRFVTSHQ